MIMYEVCVIGQLLDFLRGRGEGAIFNISDAGARLYYNFENPTPSEIAAVH